MLTKNHMPTGRRIPFRDRSSLNNVYVIVSLAASFAQEVLRRACSRMTSTGVYHDRSGATEHARPPQRIAMDGNSYTEDEFAEWYGRNYRDVWDSASPSGQDEQKAGAAEHNASAAQSTHAVEERREATDGAL